MRRKFAISDIHGNKRTFLALLDSIGFTQSDELYLLGDYIDRGPDSKGVIDFILFLQLSGHTVHCLRGNHEQLFIDTFTGDPLALQHWSENGGKETLRSYRVGDESPIPEKHLNFHTNLSYYFEVDEYILVHGGLNFDVEDPFSDKDAMLWERDWYKNINYDWLGDRIIIHGHTPIQINEIEQQRRMFLRKKYLDIDAGCFIKKFQIPGFGHLCAFNMTERTLVFQESVEER